jgi:hypothetical protein
MILYHGSNIEIEKIDLSKCRPFKEKSAACLRKTGVQQPKSYLSYFTNILYNKRNQDKEIIV